MCGTGRRKVYVEGRMREVGSHCRFFVDYSHSFKFIQVSLLKYAFICVLEESKVEPE
jgi:hypothetical protein